MWKDQHAVEYWPTVEQLATFWTHLVGELSVRTLLYYRAGNCHCWIEDLLERNYTNTTALIWDQDSNVPYLKSQQNVEILGLVCLGGSPYDHIINSLSDMLNHMREVPLILQFCSEKVYHQDIEQIATDIFKQCHELLIPNVLLLTWNFFNTGRLYTYQTFPEFRLLSHIYRDSMILLPYKLDNLYGDTIRVQTATSDYSEPFTIVTKDSSGTLVMTGMVYRLMNAFVSHLNATLEISFDSNKARSIKSTYSNILKGLLNESVDMSTTILPIGLSRSTHFISYPMAVYSWCTMLPVERMVSTREAISGIMKSPGTWLYIGLIYGLIQWIGLRHWHGVSLLRVVPSYIHLTLLCTVMAQLSAFLIHPQQLQKISSFEQLNAAGLRIIGLSAELYAYPEQYRMEYPSSFISYDNFTKFDNIRKSLNTSYGYTITSIRWHKYKVMQQYFKRPLFRYSRDLCLHRTALDGIPIKENSLYRHELNAILLRLTDSGLITYWFSQSFYDLLKLGLVHLADLSTEVDVGPLTWMDCGFIVVLYAYVLAISLLVFVLELAVYYINVCLDYL